MKVLRRHPGLSSSSPVRQAQDRLRRGSIHLVLALFFAFFFLAGSDDDSDFAVRPSDGSSSSRVTPKSSDSETSVSSSSSKIGCKTETEDNCEYGELVDDRDGQIYKTVKIGDQWWMAENLNYAYLQPTEDPDSCSFCFKNSVDSCEKYGRLYTWSAAMDSAGIWSTNGKGCGYGKVCMPTPPVRGICPEGWHLPTQAEWNDLFSVVEDTLIVGQALKSMSGWDMDGNGSDNFGFSVHPSGARLHDGDYNYVRNYANFWSSDEFDHEHAYHMYLHSFNGRVNMYEIYKGFGYSVRCLKDSPE